MLDLQLVQEEFSKRPDEDRDVTLVCLGKEPSVDPFIEDYNKKHPIGRLSVVELRTDEKYGKFFTHHPPEAEIEIQRTSKINIRIKNFISHSVIERISSEATVLDVQINDFRSMIDTVLIDTNYDGKIFNVKYRDAPPKRDELVQKEYEFPLIDKTHTIAVKIIDILGEEIILTK